MGAVTVRPIRADEHEAAGAAVRAAYQQVGPMTADYLDWVGTPSRWVPETTETLVAVDGDDVLGAVAFVLPGDGEFEGISPPAGDAGFRFLGVAPSAQGRGVGRVLVAACEQQARDRGCLRIAIHSMAFMTRAHAIYLDRGYQRRHDLDVVFPGGVGYGFHLDLAPQAGEHFPPPGAAPDPIPWYEDAWGLRDGATS